MAGQNFTLTDEWDVTKRYTAVGETPVNLANVGSAFVHWTTTMDDNLPTLPVNSATVIAPWRDKSPTLKDGERLWFAGASATATLEV